MTATRTGVIVATGARLLIGAVVAVGSVAAVSAGVLAPWPEATTGHAQTTVTTVPGDAVLSCTGAFRALGRDAGDATQMQSAASLRVTVGGGAELDTIDVPDLVGVDEAPVFTRAVEDGESPLAAASESVRLAQDDLAGLAAGACGEASTESWIVGGSTRTGASDVLVLSNPSEVAATVALQLYAEQPVSTSLVVPARTQIAVPFASLAIGVEAPVVRVTATGAPVRAVLQSALVTVLDPAGVDLQSGTTAADSTLRFAGVQIVAEDEGGQAANVLRLLAPDEDAEARVVIRDAEGAPAGEFTAPLTAGVPLDIALADLATGEHSVEVTAGTALVGGVWQSTGFGAGSDFAWMTPATEIEADTMFAVPRGPSPRLHVLSQAGAAVTLTDAAGATTRIDVPADGSVVVPVRAGSSYRLSADAPVSAAVMLAADGALAGWPVAPGAAAAEDITVVH